MGKDEAQEIGTGAHDKDVQVLQREDMTSELPLVSIGMPVFNAQETIAAALDSILYQDYPNIEIIISDNSSTDKTTHICQNYAKEDDRIKLNINKKNYGAIENFRIVAKRAKGKYFFWAAGDDAWHPGFIKTLVNELEANPRAGVALCAVRREYPNGDLKDIIRFEGKNDPNRLSGFRVAVNLLSPNKKVMALKYNLFIYGVFTSKVIQETFAIADDIFSYGERAFLTPIALAYNFHYVNTELFVKRIYEQSFKIRNPDDVFTQTRKNVNYRKYCYKIMGFIIKANNIPLGRKFFVLIIPYYVIYRFFYRQKKKILYRTKPTRP